MRDETVFAVKKVECVGQIIGAIIAKDQATAQGAAKKVYFFVLRINYLCSVTYFIVYLRYYCFYSGHRKVSRTSSNSHN